VVNGRITSKIGGDVFFGKTEDATIIRYRYVQESFRDDFFSTRLNGRVWDAVSEVDVFAD